MHEKALLTASLFGLPMFSVEHGRHARDDGHRRLRSSTDAPRSAWRHGADARPGHDSGRPADPTSAEPDATSPGRDGVASNPGEPALPRFVYNVGVDGKVLRGVGFRGGDFADDCRRQAAHRRARHRVRRQPRPPSPRPRSSRPGCGSRATSAISAAARRTSSSRPPSTGSRTRATRPPSAGSSRASTCASSTSTRRRAGRAGDRAGHLRTSAPAWQARSSRSRPRPRHGRPGRRQRQDRLGHVHLRQRPAASAGSPST